MNRALPDPISSLHNNPNHAVLTSKAAEEEPSLRKVKQLSQDDKEGSGAAQFGTKSPLDTKI